MYTNMESWAEIRRRVLVDGLSKRAACREYDIHWDTLKKILEHPEPPGYRRTVPRPRPKLDPFLPVIHQILEGDKKAPRKQRHTARRIFERLRDEHGYTGGLTVVKDAVAAWRLRSAEVFVPLAHRPVRPRSTSARPRSTLDGQTTKVALFVMTLPYSDAIFVCAFPRECTEAFLEGHVRAFAFFGGVPRRISYDNSKIAVAKITGSRDRKVTDAFLRLKSHHLFEDHFCLVRRPNEKGHVETLVGFARRSFLVPVPVVHGGLEALNADLERRCREDLARRLWGKPASKAELLDEERPVLLPLPGEAFVAARVEPPMCQLAIPGQLRRQPVLGPHAVRPPPGHGRRLGGHGADPRRRSRGRGPPAVLGPRAGVLRPGALPGAAGAQARGAGLRAPLEGWELPVCFGVLRRRLEAEFGGPGTRQFIKVLRLLEWADPAELTRAVERALELGVADADAVRLILEHRREQPVGLFCLDGRPHLQVVAVPAPDLSVYANLTAGVAL